MKFSFSLFESQPLTSLNLPHEFVNSAQGVSTLDAPSPALIEALVGLPTPSGIAVTKERAIRCVSFLSAVKVLAADIAKMPLYLMETDGKHTKKAITDPLYSLLKDAPNPWMTSYQVRWANVFSLLTQGNFYNQIVRDGLGNPLQIMPLNSWAIKQRWDKSDPANTQLVFDYDENGYKKTFQQNEIWTNTVMAINGLEGQSIILLGKDALSLMIASDETAGRSFANNLMVQGFFTTPADMVVDEKEAQKVHDDLKKNYTGSSRAGRSPMLPGGWDYKKIALTAVEGQLLESRKWNAEEIARVLGGQPLITKLGYGEKNSTYASSAAFLEEYFSTTLMPITVNIEQSIALNLIPKAKRATLYATHDADAVLRGSRKEREEADEIAIRSSKKSPNECRLADHLDPIEGLDVHFVPANCGIFDPETQSFTLPAQGIPVEEGKLQPIPAPPAKPAPVPPPAPKKSARLETMAVNAAERVVRKETKGGKIDAEFIADVMSISVSKAEAYLAKRKSGEIKDSDVKNALITLATNEEGDQ